MGKLIAITGGIGSGKSVVSRILRANGYIVYDCDNEAKKIMDNDAEIHQLLIRHIHNDAVKDGIIDRKLIASIVFTDKDKLEKLNSIVHQAVRNDITHKYEALADDSIMFIETAILYQSNIDLMVDEVWSVTAPRDLRVRRVILRNNCSYDEVLARIEAQESYVPSHVHPKICKIVNDDIQPILPRVLDLIKTATKF